MEHLEFPKAQRRLLTQNQLVARVVGLIDVLFVADQRAVETTRLRQCSQIQRGRGHPPIGTLRESGAVPLDFAVAAAVGALSDGQRKIHIIMYDV
jgi:hypothetical protein